MRLVVKVLNPGSSSSEDISVEAEAVEFVEALKTKLEQKLQLKPKENQLKLVFKGKTLQDGNSIGHYQLVDGSKLHLMLKKVSSSDPQTVSVTEPPASKTAPGISLDVALQKALRKHFASDQDTKKVVQQFKKEFNESLSALSLDDIERIAQRLNSGQALSF
ncbi:ubiquitin-like protein 4A [Tigriopus californicus]|uniref:ubiquitin-like protein 4A n=1 Tax=Tigriopus californicus TaxID=6832 RepID=UPI0027DA81F0|nr:ubiquitin-like protein 4A [Tigriopus californicus]